MHKHNFKVMDYDDADPGLVFVQCINEELAKKNLWGFCGMRGKMAIDEETAEIYDVEYLPGALDQMSKLVNQDLEALEENTKIDPNLTCYGIKS